MSVVRRRQETVKEQVLARLSSAVVGSIMQTMSHALFGDEFASAPLKTPPISAGMTDTVEKLKAVVLKEGAVAQGDYKQVRNAYVRRRSEL